MASFWMDPGKGYQWDPQMMDFMKEGALGQGGPSAAETLAQRLFDKAQRQAFGLASSQRGMNPAMAARLGAQTGSALSTDAAQQASMLRSQEQQQAIANWLQQQQAAQQGYYQQAGLDQQAQATNSGMLWKLLGGLLGSAGSMGGSGIGGMLGGMGG
jgi:hypothetical protein